MTRWNLAAQNRRTFMKEMAAAGALVLTGSAEGMRAQASPDWKKQMGLEMYTVRDLQEKDFEGTFAKVAQIGYKEVEPTEHGKLDPKQFRALLDRYGLKAPSTHVTVTAGPGLEKQLEGYRLMGHLYTDVRAAQPGAARGATPKPPRETVASVKRKAEMYNESGKVAHKFGMKILVHNHTEEFERLEGTSQLPYDILLAETDPELVAMQIDIGWAYVAGQNVIQRFRQNPGRFELWHVKDVTGMKGMDPKLTPGERRQKAKLVPIGQGEIDWKSVFSNAGLAGLKHFVIEQDNAAEGGDSMAVARLSYQNLMKILS